MKVLLTAFGGKLSGTMEWPENTEPRIFLSLGMDVLPKKSFFSKEDNYNPPVLKKCTFEWTGKYVYSGAESLREYVLTDVS